MSETPLTTESSDATLIEQVRSGQLDAYGELFARHREAANRLARHLVRGPDADDLVAESFARVLIALQNGKGPDEFFRAYLLTSLRRLHVDRIRAAKRVKTTDDESELDRAVAFVDPAEMRFEQSTAAAAFASLPERWRLVLWHLDVEGQKPAEVAPLLGMSANSVSALAYRAREGLRTAYLQGHLAPSLDDECRRTTPLLAQHVRNNLSKRDATRVDEHLDNCARCSGLYAELTEVNNHLAGLLAPALLGTAAAGYLATSGSTAAVGLLTQLADHLSRPFRWAAAGSSAGASSGVIVTVVTTLAVAGGAVAVNQLSDEDAPAIARSAESLRVDATPSAPAQPAPETAKPSPQQPEPRATPSAPASPPAVAPAAPTAPGPTQPPTSEPTTTDPATMLTPRPTPRPVLSPAPDPSPAPSPTPSPTPTPTTPGPTVTDYSTSLAFAIEPDQYLERRVTVAVTATGETPRGNLLRVSMGFNSPDGGVEYRGGSFSGWDCDTLAPGDALTSLTCAREQTGTDIPPIVFSLHGRYPGATVAITVADNEGSTTGASGRACDYLNPTVCPAY